MAYELALPPSIKIYNVFHVSLLKKYVHDLNHMLDWSLILVELDGEIQVETKCILEQRTKILMNRTIEKVKVQCFHYSLEEATWELDDEMRNEYPQLF